jgi:hypothetical protein
VRGTVRQAGLLLAVFGAVTLGLVAAGVDRGVALTAGHAAFALALVWVLTRA